MLQPASFAQNGLRSLVVLTASCIALLGCSDGGASEQVSTEPPAAESTSTTPSPTSTEPPESNVDTITLRMAHDLPQESAYHVGAQALADAASELSDGRLDIEIFPDAQLGDARAMLDGMQTGSIDIAPLGTGFMSGVLPAVQFIDLPFLWEGSEHAYGVLDGQPANEILGPMFGEQGLVQLVWWELGWRQVTNSVRPIAGPDDMQGIALRVPESPLYLASWELTGANVTPLDFAELYSALEQGVVDGQENPLNLICSVRFYEVQDYLSLSDHAYSAAALVVSAATWEQLDDELRGVLQDAAEQSRDAQREAASGADSECLETIRDAGVDVTDAEEVNRQAFRETMQSAWQIYLDSVDEAGQQLLDVVEGARN